MSNRSIIPMARLFLSVSVFCAGLFPGFSYGTTTDSAETYFRPWSGYWWSTNGGGLANGYGQWGHPAPMEKFEMLTTGSYPGEATQWELDNYYDPEAPDWNGQCHAWAAASAYENIVFYPSSYDNILFRVGDKKGLLSACHGSDTAVRAAGLPNFFHEWLLNYIKVHRKAFVADLGSPDEAWFYPIFKYEMQLTPGSGEIGVICKIWYADDNVNPDFQGTQVRTDIYTYTLFINGNNEIIGGEWTGTSIWGHPKSFFFALSPQATNPYLNYDVIRQIAVHKDDFLETDGPVRLLPGAYNLVLLNEDLYTLDGKPGDTLCLAFEKLDDFQEGIQVILKDASDEILWQETLYDPLTWTFTVVNPPYQLILSRSFYGGGGMYRVVLDQHKVNEVLIPEIQKGSAWNGVSVTNTGEQPVGDIQIVTYDTNHQPIATVKGPYELGPLKKDTWLLSGMPLRLHEISPVRSLKILADDPLAVLYLCGSDGKSMSGYGQHKGPARKWIFPDTSGMFDISKYVTWGLVNKSPDPVELNCQLFSQLGDPDRQRSFEIGGHDVAYFTPTSNPFYKAIDNGWISVEAPAVDGIEGFFRWGKDGAGGTESIFALTQTDTMFCVPHVARSSTWRTELTLINLSSDTVNDVVCQLVNEAPLASATVTLGPLEKGTFFVSDLFPWVDDITISESALIIIGQKALTGYFAYRAEASSAVIELMNGAQVGRHLVLPHIASDSYWWTGIAIYNPWWWMTSELVELTPINVSGMPMDWAAVTMTIPPLAKRVFTLRSIFDDSVLKETAWVRITAAANGVMGVFLYGDSALDLLSGGEVYLDPAADEFND